MSRRSGQQYHEFWGTFALRADLPNVAGSPLQNIYLDAGDYAWVTGELTAFRCLDATLGAAIWVAEVWSDASLGVVLVEDWISLTAAGQSGWSVISSGPASSSQINNSFADSEHLGIAESATGNGTGGSSVLYLGTDGIVTPAAGGLIVANATARVPVLSDATQEFVSRFLFGDSLVSAADHTDGIYFEYNRALNGDLWACKTAAAGVRTTTVTAVPVVPGSWYRMMAIITDSLVSFFLDDVLVATHVTNIPTGTAQRYAPNMRINKTAGNQARTHLIDYFQSRLVTAMVR